MDGLGNLIFGVLGGALMFNGLFLAIRYEFRKRYWMSVIGRVDAIVESSDSESGPMAQVLYEVDHVRHVVCGGSAPRMIGDDARVLYNPKNPSSGIVHEWDLQYFAPILCIGFGAMVLYVSTRSL